MALEPKRASDDPFARMVDGLLKKLPSADPSLKGDPDEPGPPGGRAAVVTKHVPPPPPRRLSLAERIAVWLRVVLGLVLGLVITQWPYARDCGWPLAGYLTAVVAVIVAAIWAGLVSWQRRVGAAHVASLVLGLWGLALAAERVLPRVGYAAEPAAWFCSGSSQGGASP